MTDPFATSGRLLRQLEGLLRSAAEPSTNPVPAASPAITAAVRRSYEAGRERDGLFGGIFADPSWDLLLDLFLAGEEDRPVDAFSLCRRSALSDGVILRSLAHLVQSKFVTRQPDAPGSATIYLALTAEGRAKINDYFSRTMAIAGGVAA